MPSTDQIRQFLTLTVLPVVVAAVTNWIVVHVHALAEFHVTAGSVASVVSQLGVFAVTAAIAFLTSHHILKGTYSPRLRGGPATSGVLGTATLKLDADTSALDAKLADAKARIEQA